MWRGEQIERLKDAISQIDGALVSLRGIPECAGRVQLIQAHDELLDMRERLRLEGEDDLTGANFNSCQSNYGVEK
jgi:hypothetical protein